MLGGWTLAASLTSTPDFRLAPSSASCDPNNDRNGDGTCPDLPAAYFGGAIKSPSKQQWINGIFPNPATEFDVTTRGPGCRCRNIFSGPGYTSVDLSFGKDFKFPAARFIGESAKLELRANFFNAFNILNLTPLIPATAPRISRTPVVSVVRPTVFPAGDRVPGSVQFLAGNPQWWCDTSRLVVRHHRVKHFEYKHGIPDLWGRKSGKLSGIRPFAWRLRFGIFMKVFHTNCVRWFSAIKTEIPTSMPITSPSYQPVKGFKASTYPNRCHACG